MRLLTCLLSSLLFACDSPGRDGGGGQIDCTVTPNVPGCLPDVGPDDVVDTTPETTVPDVSPDTDGPPDTSPADTDAMSDTSLADTDAMPDTSLADTDVSPDTEPADTVAPRPFYAIIVDDDGIFQNHRNGLDPCATSSLGAHGADIDAVGLFEADGTTLVGYFDVVQARLGTTCDIGTTFSDPTEGRGAPNGRLAENYVSLGGGAIIGEFGEGILLLEGDVVVVYEVGTQCGNDTNCGGIDESYHVFVAEGPDCLGRTRSTCQVRVTMNEGERGESTIPLSGF